MLLINDNRDSIYLGIESERKLQDEKWGGPDHDDTHSVFEWVAIIQYFLGELLPPKGGSFLSGKKIFSSKHYDLGQSLPYSKI